VGPYADELRITAPLARKAGDIALRYHGTSLSVDRKPGDEPVTIADRECSEFLVDELRSAFPDDVVISEEEEDSPLRLSEGRVWYIDPIDGTKDFIAGGTGYCVMMGLAIAHRPVFGLIFQPNHQTLLYASHGGGAWCERKGGRRRMHCSRLDNATQARLLTKDSGDHLAIQEAFGIPADAFIGSIGMKLAALALGSYELYVNPATRCSSWDTCAPEILLQEAGGAITDMHGRPIRYDNPETTSLQRGIIASSGPMHEDFVSRLAQALTPPIAD